MKEEKMDEEGYESGAHPLLVLLALDMVVFDWVGLLACGMSFIALALRYGTFRSLIDSIRHD